MAVKSHKLKLVESEIWHKLLFSSCLNSSYSILKLQNYILVVKKKKILLQRVKGVVLSELYRELL